MTEELREKIAEIIGKRHGEDKPYCIICHRLADGIVNLLKQAGYVRLSKDQSLPEVPNACDLAYDVCDICYRQAQQDMLKAGFVKCLPKEGK